MLVVRLVHCQDSLHAIAMLGDLLEQGLLALTDRAFEDLGELELVRHLLDESHFVAEVPLVLVHLAGFSFSDSCTLLSFFIQRLLDFAEATGLVV